jgi:hypothetical protein
MSVFPLLLGGLAAPARAKVQQASVRVAAQSSLEGWQVLDLRGASELGEHGDYIRFFSTEKGLNFGTIRPALQAEIDKVK